ncbi:MAG: FAD-dependent oxidoreductase [Streptosporangiaceae bacterium]
MTVHGTESLPSTVDVVVAGSGAAGLTAALAAATGGASVLVVERADELGGTTALSGGRVWVPGNHLPENAGDGPDAAGAYLRGLFSDRYPHMTKAFVETAPTMARFVEEHSPHRFVACPNYPDYYPSRPGATLGGRALDMEPIDLTDLTPLVRSIRTPRGYVPMTHAEWEKWRYPQRFDWTLLDDRLRRGIRTGGVALVAALLDGAVSAGVRVATGTRLVRVHLGEDGGVRSADLEHDGGTTTLPASSVILATGGFDWNDDLRARAHPGPQAATGAPPSNTGDTLRVAEEVGAEIDNIGEGWWMPMIRVPGETLDGRPFYRSLIRERGAPRQIMVNAAGRRFVDEALPYNEIGKAFHRRDAGGYPNEVAYLIFDEEFRRSYPLPAVRPDRPLPGWVARADSLAELAAGIAVDGPGLADSVERWNRSCGSGNDTDFGRGSNPYDRYYGDPDTHPNPNLGPIDEPPYYAVRILAGTIGTKGGPVTDEDAGVRTPRGGHIRGLYAVGNASAFWTADGYPGPGATLAVGMTMGYRAGRHAAPHGSRL